jgi:RNA polymerase sigma-70 factor (ECF subfamily)
VNDILVAALMDDLTALAVLEGAPAPTTSERIAEAYDLHQRELFTFALRCSRDREIAEDLVHEAFLRLIVEFEAGREPDNVRAWLYRVTANLNISRARRAAVAHKQAGELASRETAPGPEPLFLDHERRSDIDAALAELVPDARTALLMAANGFSGMEIAEAIGRTGIATRAMMCRARLQLRQRLGSYEAMA